MLECKLYDWFNSSVTHYPNFNDNLIYSLIFIKNTITLAFQHE